MSSLAEMDVLVRLRVAARCCGRTRLRLRRVSDELRELIVYCGLDEALGLEPRREAEEREQRLGVEEERELGDSSLFELEDL
jgi:hypothetical protein